MPLRKNRHTPNSHQTAHLIIFQWAEIYVLISRFDSFFDYVKHDHCSVIVYISNKWHYHSDSLLNQASKYSAIEPSFKLSPHHHKSIWFWFNFDVLFHSTDPPGSPYIEGYTTGETLRRGQNVELVCKSRGGNPPAQLIWYKNGVQVRMAYRWVKRFHIFPTNLLIQHLCASIYTYTQIFNANGFRNRLHVSTPWLTGMKNWAWWPVTTYNKPRLNVCHGTNQDEFNMRQKELSPNFIKWKMYSWRSNINIAYINTASNINIERCKYLLNQFYDRSTHTHT